jgi:hypothetical protein
MNNEDIGENGGGINSGGINGEGEKGEYDNFENTILITLKDTNNLVKILYDKINLIENENAKFKKQIYYLNKNLTELKEQNVNLNNKIEQGVTDTDLNDFIVNSVNQSIIDNNGPIIDNNESIINESDIINEINFISKDNEGKGDKGGKGDKVGKEDKDYIKNKLKKLIMETKQNEINVNKRKKNMLFTMR